MKEVLPQLRLADKERRQKSFRLTFSWSRSVFNNSLVRSGYSSNHESRRHRERQRWGSLVIANIMPMGAIAPVPSASGATAPSTGGGFLGLINGALHDVSNAQSAASVAEAGFATGVPGATVGKALVASDRAEVAWNATVAVRNEVVSAYQSVMNMQF